VGGCRRSLQRVRADKGQLLSTAVIRKVRHSLNDLLASMRSLSNRIFQYDIVIGYKSDNALLSELTTKLRAAFDSWVDVRRR
jgi:hypothetical protein